MRGLARRELAVLVGIFTALHTWFTWGAWQPRPVVEDEFSYVLQANIFASGHWVAPSPPSEQAFQQPHVLVTPVLASKYPPGHPLVLAPGALAGVAWLVPIILAGVSGAVLFLLLADAAPTWAALCGWAYWLSDPLALRFRPSFYSESTSALTWLVAWWLLGHWRQSGERRYLVWLSVAIGWCAITRPFTAIALAAPVGVYVLYQLGRGRAWKDVALAAVAGACVVSILAFADYTVTGNPLKTPFSLYAEEYLPFDKLGFEIDSTSPRLRLAPPIAGTYTDLIKLHDGHVPARLPAIAAVRLRELATAEWSEWRVLFVPLIAIGLWGLSTVEWLAVASAATLFLSYLMWAHWYGWSIYYYEALPVLAMAASRGMDLVGRRIPRTRLTLATTSVLALLLGIGVWRNTSWWRVEHAADARSTTEFQNALKELPFAGSVVFVRYSADVHVHPNRVVNSPTWARDPVWVVNSWGPSADLKLLSASGQRVPLLFDEKTQLISTYRELLDSLRLRR